MLIVSPSVRRAAFAVSVGVAEALGYSPRMIERSLRDPSALGEVLGDVDL
jgi:hypothetical protein